MTKYSIILPVRNGGAYVKECVNSILAQTYTDFNLLVLDNCSTDDTVQWIRSLNDDRIRIFPSETSLGIGANWQRITTIPKNEFITVTGHDDLLHENYLEEMDALIAQHPEASLYQSHFNYINSTGYFVRPCLPMDQVQYGHEFLACQMARTMDSMGTGYMMRSKDFDEAGGLSPEYPNLIFADYELWMKLTMKSYKATSNNFCFSYRLHDSASRLTNGEEYATAFGEYVQFIQSILHVEKIKTVIENYGADFLMYFCESLSHRILKTPMKLRTLKVADFINNCEGYAAQLIPGKSFSPRARFRISIAEKLDNNPAGRELFHLFKKTTGK